ncbi:DUF5336 domain-containing protein [Prauserella rugosa]|uniref:Uncharacterized protein n=1 Tax=Prauserella rugosa TaxID=43354 RepID=A0A660CKA0_9PSEU|nr:DUF5336 domain-containing protein [Prauserella rugosa]KMS88557.1 hypothetical protein ACZ91_25215 [Streptomyces regensis]TWH22307.1 hypothetical protein JD82_04184 [Prauserella rugosa]
MSFPSGGPGTGGFPGQGPQQPQQSFPGPPAPQQGGGGLKISLPQILFLAVAGLGLVNLFLGFANFAVVPQVETGIGFYEEGSAAWLPMMFFLSGLAALLTILPGEHKPGPWPALLAVGVLLPFLFITFASEREYGAGAIMILIFGIVQTLAAVAAYLFDENIIKPPQPKPVGQPGSYGQQPQGGYPGQAPQQPQSGGFPQQNQPPQPVNPHAQPTAYAPQHGQFFQPQDPGQQGQQGQQGQPGQGPQPGA